MPEISERFEQFEECIRAYAPDDVKEEMANFRNWCRKVDAAQESVTLMAYLQSVYHRYDTARIVGDEPYVERTRFYLGVVFEKMLEGEVYGL